MKFRSKNNSTATIFAIAGMLSIPMLSFAAELKYDDAAVSAACAQSSADKNAIAQCVSLNGSAYKVVYDTLAAEQDQDVRMVMGGCIENNMPNWVAVADCVSHPAPALNATIPVAGTARLQSMPSLKNLLGSFGGNNPAPAPAPVVTTETTNVGVDLAQTVTAAPATAAQAFNSGTLAGQLMATTGGVPTATAQKLVQMCITQWQGDPAQSKYCLKKEIDGWKALNIN